MRFDQSMRVLKQLLEWNELGMPVLGTIEMRATALVEAGYRSVQERRVVRQAEFGF
jgi:hypothetical protein